jgi:hypothetical protein
MGNSTSKLNHKTVFEKELPKLNTLINDIINDKDIFKNKQYNFLSQDICQNYQIVLEEELSKYLKLDIKNLGASLYIIPKNTDADNHEKLTKYKLTKAQVCEKISNHYIKILYIMCLVKYVYNLEMTGDLSIAGIVFRNIKIVDDMMQIYFCGMPHKNYHNKDPKTASKIDFSKLEGMKFFTHYFLDPEESYTFINILKNILAKSSSNKIKQSICEYLSQHGAKDYSALEKLYKIRYPNEKLNCAYQSKHHAKYHAGGGSVNVNANLTPPTDPKLFIYIEKDNPIFLSDYCAAPIKLVVKLNTPEGKKLLAHYKKMLASYEHNVASIYSYLTRMVHKNPHTKIYELRDIDKHELDMIIHDIKLKIKEFYIQSIFDFQNLLDMAKTTPNIHIN